MSRGTGPPVVAHRLVAGPAGYQDANCGEDAEDHEGNENEPKSFGQQVQSDRWEDRARQGLPVQYGESDNGIQIRVVSVTSGDGDDIGEACKPEDAGDEKHDDCADSEDHVQFGCDISFAREPPWQDCSCNGDQHSPDGGEDQER